MKYIEYGKENSEVIMMLHGGGLSWWNYRKEAELLCDSIILFGSMLIVGGTEKRFCVNDFGKP